jgi:pimeloyl-ACP methyl ester carboxylesterase
MNAAHPIPKTDSQPLKIILIGTSGGAQVALGAASYLHDWLNAQLIVLSVGGAFDGNTGFEQVSHIYHLQGRQDWVENVTSILFAGRWPLTVASPFNRAKQQGRYTIINSGPHEHDGSKGYFGTESIEKSDITYVELTLEKVNQLPIW